MCVTRSSRGSTTRLGSMKAAVIHQNGGPDVLSYEDVPDPDLIHAGAGGVGIAAIQLAKQVGATVLSTA
jgi:NADPH:quinone reductase-like Zn-dependent oxidoreductase